MIDPATGYVMPIINTQTKLNFAEVDEISDEDIEAAAEKLDEIKANPAQYFTKPADREKIIKTLEKSAASLENQSEKIDTDVSGNWTHKRQRQADSNAKKKNRLLLWSKMLIRLSILWKENNVPELLSKVRNATDIDFILYNSYPDPPDKDTPIGGWYREKYPKLLKKALSLGMRNKDESQCVRKALEEIVIVRLTPEEEKAKLLKEKLKEVRGFNLPGFFPTPDDLIDKMIQYSRLEDDHYLLEPSAGIGSILDRVRFHNIQCKIDAVEIRPSLEKILRLKGYNSSCEDILNTSDIKGRKWDRILMNPPFENGQDVEHVMHCFDYFLEQDGVLVSIMSAGVKTNQQIKYVDFRNWVEDLNGFFIDNGQAFKGAFNSTGVSSVMLVIQK